MIALCVASLLCLAVRAAPSKATIPDSKSSITLGDEAEASSLSSKRVARDVSTLDAENNNGLLSLISKGAKRLFGSNGYFFRYLPKIKLDFRRYKTYQSMCQERTCLCHTTFEAGNVVCDLLAVSSSQIC